MLPILKKNDIRQRIIPNVILENNGNLEIIKNPTLDSNQKKELYQMIKDFDKSEMSVDKEFYSLWKQKNSDSDINEFLNSLKSKGSVLYILKNNNSNVLGFCIVRVGHVFLKNVISITDIGISKNLRGQGYGKYLFKYVINELENDYPNMNILLNVFDRNNIAKKMYTSFGFRPATLTMVKFK